MSFLRPALKYRRIIKKLFARWTQMRNDKKFNILLMEFWSLLYFLKFWSRKWGIGSETTECTHLTPFDKTQQKQPAFSCAVSWTNSQMGGNLMKSWNFNKPLCSQKPWFSSYPRGWKNPLILHFCESRNFRFDCAQACL